MTTIIDVIDTSVKIGLGAIISGVATYWVTTANNKHELKKLNLEISLKLLREIAEQFDQSKALINDFVYALNKDEENCEDSLSESYKVTSRTHALANMIGQEDLTSAVKDYSSEIDALYDHYLRNPDSDINQLLSKLNKSKDVVEPLIADSYKNLSA